MIVYQTNDEGVYVGPVEADESPLEPGVWLIPRGCVEVEPPPIPQGQMAVWSGGAWSVQPIPVPPSEPEVEPPTPQQPVLSFPQLLYGLVKEQWITHAEADAWLVNRTLPAGVDALIAQLPADQQILAKARALQPTAVYLTDEMVQQMGAAQGKTSEEMLAFFTAYSEV